MKNFNAKGKFYFLNYKYSALVVPPRIELGLPV